MLGTLSEIRRRLERVIDDNGSVRDMDSAAEAISLLERTAVTKEALEETRLGLHVNNIRRASRNSPLAKRAKNLIKSWQQMIDKKEAMRTQRTRPETPNSLGSSPSPPEPPRDCIVHSHSSPQLAARLPRSETPTFDVRGKKNKRRKVMNDGMLKIGRKGDTIDGSKILKVQSSQVKFDKQSLDTGQSAKLNGFKVSPKGRSSMTPVTNPSPLFNNNHSPYASTKSQNRQIPVPPKPQKRKKELQTPYKAPSPLPILQVKPPEDIYRKANMKSSKSAPNFTVNKSPSNDKLFRNDRSTSSSALNSNDKTSSNLKRKRDIGDSADLSSEKSRKPKERRLTYDPVTNQLTAVPSDETTTAAAPSVHPPEKLLSKLAIKDHTVTSQKVNAENNRTKQLRKNNLVKLKTGESKTASWKSSEKSMVPDKNGNFALKHDFPSEIYPSVSILDSDTNCELERCNGECSSTNFHDLYREYKKRKTRRKDPAAIELTSLYPLSSLVESVSSDSDDNSTSNRGFSSSIISKAKNNTPRYHSQYCKLPGVTGCHGNNGSWFDWTQMFCVRNNANSEPLPDESEILPLQVLPYVELD